MAGVAVPGSRALRRARLAVDLLVALGTRLDRRLALALAQSSHRRLGADPAYVCADSAWFRCPSAPTRRRGRGAAEEGGELGAVAFGERLEQLVLGVEEGGERGVDGRPALGGEPHDHATPVVGVRVALDEPARAEPVDPVGHGAAGHERLAEEAAGGELVRRTGAAQRGQHVELPLLDAVRREGVAAGQLEAPGQPADPAEHRRPAPGRGRRAPGPRPRAARPPRRAWHQSTSRRES